MKRNKVFFTLIVLFFCVSVNAQKEIPDSTEVLFDDNGSFTRVINTPEEVEAKLIRINPLIDEVVWRKVVTRVIDLREQVNRPLYYPKTDMDEISQKNLFAIMMYYFHKGDLVGYDDGVGGPNVPKFIEENKKTFEEIGFLNDYTNYEDYPSIYERINYLSEGVIKYYVQEVWYFNKTTSTFHNKIIAIAPFFDERYHIHNGGDGAPKTKDGIVWFPYDKLRPFLHILYLIM